MQKDPLKEAMLRYAPEIEADYKAFVRQIFKNLIEKYGVNLKGIYNSNDSRIFRAIRSSVKDTTVNYRDIVHTLDEDRLDKEAKRYAEDTALAWYGKMKEKLGNLENVTVSDPRQGGEVTVQGTHGTDDVRIDQHRIINVSPYGLLFHQFPARIYVNGKFQSEAEYKGLTDKWGITVKREEKPQRPIIDPMSRPREFHFRYTVVYKNDDGRNRPDWTREETFKGMTEEEARNKLVKKEMREGYYSEAKNIELLNIRAWNHIMLWSKDKGNIPVPEKRARTKRRQVYIPRPPTQRLSRM